MTSFSFRDLHQGGKKGVELAGCADMVRIRFVCFIQLPHRKFQLFLPALVDGFRRCAYAN